MRGLISPHLLQGEYMPQALRPIPKLAKLAYKLLKTPKDQQQHNQKKPTEKQKREWATTTIAANNFQGR